MYEENKAADLVAYMDGQPVGVCEEFPEFSAMEPSTETTQAAGGITAEKLAEVAGTIRATFDAITPAFEKLAKSLRRLSAAIVLGYEFQQALRWAEVYNPKPAHFFHHTKKRRIRKKCAKRILAWYRAEVLK